MPKVEFNLQNLFGQCICWKCPVQNSSPCIKERSAFVKKLAREKKVVNPKKTDGLYCAKAVGKTDCGGLDPTKLCVCGECPIWKNKNLIYSFYCLRGDADAVDNYLLSI